jgi:hypothetical protein
MCPSSNSSREAPTIHDKMCKSSQQKGTPHWATILVASPSSAVPLPCQLVVAVEWLVTVIPHVTEILIKFFKT